jgi:hypothetical protein
MSIDFYLVCHDCKKRISIAQDGLGGWTFYSGEADCMAKLGRWLGEHALIEGSAAHRLALVTEHDERAQDYCEIEWRGASRRRDAD